MLAASKGCEQQCLLQQAHGLSSNAGHWNASSGMNATVSKTGAISCSAELSANCDYKPLDST